jgi:hypothetical protein
MSIKDTQLGMPVSNARNRLIKMLLFSTAQKLGIDNCFRCGETIESIDNFSIEHKIPWLHSDNPVALFFDLDNVAFSHTACNSSAARHPKRISDTDRVEHKRCSRIKLAQQRAGTEEWKKYQRDYHRNRYHSDPEFRKDRLDRRNLYRQTGTSANTGD